MKFQPAIKWSGSKRSQSEKITEMIAEKEYNVYYEPFCGGCSVLFQLLHSNKRFKKYICSDKNDDLISLWNMIKDNPIKIIEAYETMWNELNVDNNIERKKQYFNTVKDRFNKLKNPCDFMFIMRTTTNGMPRYNKKGEFNNSFHVTRNGIKPNTFVKIINEWANVLNEFDVKFICRNYNEVIVTEDDFIYLDPPYANTKGMYYGTIDYDELWNWLRKQKCDYMLSFDTAYNIPEDTYDKHEYIYSGNSSFRRTIGKSSNEYIYESLYIKSSSLNG